MRSSSNIARFRRTLETERCDILMRHLRLPFFLSVSFFFFVLFLLVLFQGAIVLIFAPAESRFYWAGTRAQNGCGVPT